MRTVVLAWLVMVGCEKHADTAAATPIIHDRACAHSRLPTWFQRYLFADIQRVA